MHCWKTINVKKEYGTNRLLTFAAIAGTGVFAAFYVLLNLFYTAPLSDRYFFFFILSMLAIYPLHKMLHFLPLIGSRKCLKLIIKKQLGMLPGFSLHVKEPVAKTRFLLALMSPVILLNMGIIAASVFYPAYIHYFAILLAYHCSLCLTDVIYIRHLLHTPKHAFIEETDTGFEILVPPPMS
ncbi:DUF3267 domain-containing protein [Planococcus sp. CAU13]|uniref:DUF3267 domain-containing protein n=1 Tax=Planococcus sp. CAU13 TaxID=1541197 RepID=UPI00052FF70F|nr:DUF3267 domain-containing protein [Planococcus sp. CAU13]